jgi:sugar phosphate permease
LRPGTFHVAAGNSYLSTSYLIAVAPPRVFRALVILAIGLFFYTLFNIFNAAVMDVVPSNVQATAYGFTSLITQIVVIPPASIAGYLTGTLGIRSAFVLSEALLSSATVVLLPLQLYRGTRSS